jgi:UPF0755 protein
MARAALRLLSLFLAALVAFGGIGFWGYAQYVRPGPLETATTAIIPPGTGLDGITRILTEHGIIADPNIFRWGARLSGVAPQLRAGEYAFPAKVSAEGASDVLRSGKTVVHRLTVAEGLTVAQVMVEIDGAEALMGDHGSAPDEGRLLPETYNYSYGDRRSAMVTRMREAMDQALDRLWNGRAEGLPLRSMHDALVLASIVEKETGLADERPRIARVFLNRLQKGMRLQSDPTVSYGLTKGQVPLDRALTGLDLRTASPFNTYLIDGLPPTPICNPGVAAIAAVLHPADTDALYFVADGTGGHVFARTLEEHQRNVARWRQIQNGRPTP